MESVAVKATKREQAGKKGARDVRRKGLIPAIVYGGDTVESITVDFFDVRDAIYTPQFKLVSLELDGDTFECIVKAVQFHPVTEDIEHIDFLRLIPGHPIKVEVPLKFVGVSPGIRSGGKLMQKVRRLKIKAAPEDLVDEIIVDISGLKLGQSVRVRDAQVGEGLEVLSSSTMPVASVEVPRALLSVDEEEEEEELLEGEGEESAEGAADGAED